MNINTNTIPLEDESIHSYVQRRTKLSERMLSVEDLINIVNEYYEHGRVLLPEYVTIAEFAKKRETNRNQVYRAIKWGNIIPKKVGLEQGFVMIHWETYKDAPLERQKPEKK